MRILFISFYFAPYNSVGAVRATRLAEWLQRLGHDVFVLTADRQPFPTGLDCALGKDRITATAWSNRNAPVDFLLGRRRVAQSGYAGGARRGMLGRMARFYRTVLHWPDAQTGWREPAMEAGRRLLRSAGPLDLLYASAPPFTAFTVAAALARENGVPWVAEYRDLWTDNHAYDYPAWRHRIEARQEERVLAGASAAVTVSQPLADRLAKRFRLPIRVVTNGYDAHDLRTMSASADGPFHVAYTGSLYKAYDVDALVGAVEASGLGPQELRITLRGRNLGAAEEAVRASRAAALFDIAPTIAREDALRLQAGADALLFFCWNGVAGEGVLTAKLFEYLGARRPILGVGDPASETGALITRDRRGFVSRDAAALAAWLKEGALAKRGGGRSPDLPEEGLEPYSREAQARVLDGFLRGMVAR